MALEAGVMAITVEYAQGLKNSDWFGKQDPYCIIRVGAQTFRTRTAVDGGKSPVWNETFRFNVINENTAEIDIKDEDVGRDDLIGSACFSLSRARENGSDRINVGVIRKKSRKQHGYISISLTWTPCRAVQRPSHASAQPASAVPYPTPHPSYYPTTSAPPVPIQAPSMTPPGAYYAQFLTAPAPAPAPYGAPAPAYAPYPGTSYPSVPVAHGYQ